MNAYRIGVRLWMQVKDGFELHQAVPVFHQWIQGQLLAGHLLIDVADYMHVEDGPGVVLVSHEANIGLDHRGGQWGLNYVRKRPFGTAFPDRVRTVIGCALAAAARLESDLPGTRFRTDRLHLRLLDKLNVPNEAEILSEVLPPLQSVLGGLYGGPVRIEPHFERLRHFEVSVQTDSSPALADLLRRAPAAPA